MRGLVNLERIDFTILNKWGKHGNSRIHFAGCVLKACASASFTFNWRQYAHLCIDLKPVLKI